MRQPASYWIDTLQLSSHIEGGAYKEVYRSDLMLRKAVLPEAFKGDRHLLTSIYFLLEQGQFSAFHRIASDELWHFYYGDALSVYEILPDGSLIRHLLGNDPAKGESFHCVVQAGSWFASRPAIGSDYALVGCTVGPGFDYADFELAERELLVRQYPQHAELITSLTR